MRTFGTVKGLPVFDARNANCLGKIADVVISADGKVSGLVLDGRGLFRKDRFIPLASIGSVGEDGVMIQDTEMLQPLAAAREGYRFHGHGQLLNKTVYSSSGEQLGLLEDVYFSEQLGTIVAYELTDGFFADLAEGRKKVNPLTEEFTVSKDAIVMNVIQE
ncbi:photosystem reaction center subunit H [Bacillus mangrovi]|uniref:Photosystem reaction center subunit H n=1 Tax=Metabacillus mangrovi TaxID=1491830 RepID=A0A7X2V3L5_9BACI|nr:PRC-barrel domain-containing protein [Metabacillus mangrovi]MTH52530.1 photosystem reaction center subunit H [Metabacillus mangrovi]